MGRGRMIAVAGIVLTLAVFFDLTLVHLRGAPGVNLVPLRTIRADLKRGGSPMVVNVVGNLAVVFPLGALLPAASRRMRRAGRVAAAGFGVSLLVESLQAVSRRRVADVDDLILNTLGVMLGYLAWLSCDALVRTITARRARHGPPRDDGPRTA